MSDQADKFAAAHRSHRVALRARLDTLFDELRTLENVPIPEVDADVLAIMEAIELRHATAVRLEQIDAALLALSRSRLDEARGLTPDSGDT